MNNSWVLSKSNTSYKQARIFGSIGGGGGTSGRWSGKVNANISGSMDGSTGGSRDESLGSIASGCALMRRTDVRW